jgi:hypothetical protein
MCPQQLVVADRLLHTRLDWRWWRGYICGHHAMQVQLKNHIGKLDLDTIVFCLGHLVSQVAGTMSVHCVYTVLD